jgi:hypothetical protein
MVNRASGKQRKAVLVRAASILSSLIVLLVPSAVAAPADDTSQQTPFGTLLEQQTLLQQQRRLVASRGKVNLLRAHDVGTAQCRHRPGPAVGFHGCRGSDPTGQRTG